MYFSFFEIQILTARSVTRPAQLSTVIARGSPNPSRGLPPPQPQGNQQPASQSSNHGRQVTSSADFSVETSVENSQQRSQQLEISKCMLLCYGCFHCKCIKKSYFIKDPLKIRVFKIYLYKDTSNTCSDVQHIIK